MTTLLALSKDPAGELSRKAFEDAAWGQYLKVRALRTIDGDVDGEPTREGCFWRKRSGTYGVDQWNAAWWAWQAALALPMYERLP